MIRFGDQIRLTDEDQEIWQPLNGGKPLDVTTVAEFNQFLERCKADYAEDSPEDRFARSTLNFYMIKD